MEIKCEVKRQILAKTPGDVRILQSIYLRQKPFSWEERLDLYTFFHIKRLFPQVKDQKDSLISRLGLTIFSYLADSDSWQDAR